ncbi:MAG: ATP-binding protein [Treponema sp.]|nr:ATP-binding protein [Treponema sp.]
MQRIKSFTITKLFGYKENNFTVNLVDDSQITFIYAFNGVGKTTILKILYAVIQQNIQILLSVNFESIILDFNQDEKLIVKKLNNETNQFFYELRCPKRLFGYHSYVQTLSSDNETESSEIKQFLSNIDSDILFANKDYGRVVRADDSSIEFYAPYLETDFIPISLREVKNLIAQKEEEISRNQKKIEDFDHIVKKEEIARLGGSIAGTTAGVLGATAAGLAAFGPVGVLSVMAGGAIGTYVNLFNRKNKKKDLDHVVSAELLIQDGQKYIDIPLPDKINYIQKTLKYKLSEEKISQKIDLYEDIINSYNTLTDKTLHINRENGELEIRTIFSNTETLAPKYLSSGEKNLLLLYFHIIFIIPESINEDETFIELIDEPEASMHSAWLMNFVESLKHINDCLHRKDNYQYIITTHSPGITFANSDLMVELKRD